MDESGGSGQPRSGTDGSAEPHAGPPARATDPTPPDPHDNGTRPASDRPAETPDAVAASQPAAEGDPAQGTTPPVDADEQPAEPPAPEAAEPAEPADGAPQAAGTAEPTNPADTAPQAAEPAGTVEPAGTAEPTKPADTAPQAAHPRTAHDRPQHPADRPQPEDTADHHRTLAHSGTAAKSRPPQSPQPRGGLLMGRPFGVPVYVAPSWFLVAALITWVFGGQLDRVLPELGAARYLVSLFFAVAFYASVLVHELAHTVAALRFKLPVRRIQLQFFGGVSEIEKEAETPGREFVLAFVGPLLSLVLAGVFYLAMQPVEPGTVPGVLLAGLMISNLIVAAFNLLPGLPLDGGRMLRAVVWKITGRPMSGTIAAAWVGRALAVCVLIGLPLLTQSGALGSSAEDNVGMDTVMDALLAAILAAIIWTGAGNSLRMARLREHLPELRARTLTRRAVPVETDTPLSEALRRANDSGARALVVVDAEGTPLSLVREAAIVGVPEHRRPWVAVSGLAQDLTDGMRVSAELAGEDLLDALRATPATEYLVVEETGEIYGVLSAADVERAFVKAMARPS
ncbi:site-2 protease family protein [Streptomyces griseorubiginosus]|uniref:site-2 protease family protein n=1 Tax=Streptomyces griseorubiginosus TaxID=67304 RepID=UPI0033DAC5F9